MPYCPVHTSPVDHRKSLVERLRDPALVITLACDFAEHVVDLTPDPPCARKWLDTARLSKFNSNSDVMERIQDEAWCSDGYKHGDDQDHD